MIIHTLKHRARLWDVVIHLESDRSRDCSPQLIFVARDAPELKFARSVESRTFDLIAASPRALSTTALLREFLEREIRGRPHASPAAEPSAEPGEAAG